ncbi:MATE family efflux transporter [Lutibacter sp. B2]|nr:MATE family efflux transporter [Lutibacter sp. B2]
MKLSFSDKQFYKQLMNIAVPIAIQNFISSTLNMVDTMMIGTLGATEIAAVGFANQYFFLFMLISFGTYSGASIFASQFWGKKDVTNVRRVLGLSLIIGLSIGLLFTLAGLLIPETMISLLSNDLEIINMGSQYLKIVCLGYIASTISFAYGFSSRSIGNAKLPTLVSAIALCINTVLNYCLIFGHFGFPSMGVKGAALATIIARLVEMLLLLTLIYKNQGPLAGTLHELFDLSRSFVIKILNVTTPVILNETFWALGMTMYLKAYGKLGTEAVAAVQISNTIQNIFLVITMGLGNACAIMVGNKIGANQEKEGILYAKRFAKLSIFTGIVMGTLLILTSPFILSFFNPSLYTNCRNIMIVMALLMPVKMFTSVLIVGIFRSGGDTKFSLILEIGTVWLIGVPLAFLSTTYLNLPIHLAFALVNLEEIIKTMIGLPRFLSNKWLRNVIEDL